VSLYKTLTTKHVPTDPNLWARSAAAAAPHSCGRYGLAASRDDDESQAYQCHLESFRNYPVDMEVISWLGAYHVKSEMYEEAMQYFQRATEIQPKEVKWRLMVASCHRRIGSFQQALKIYEDIHRDHPDNVECEEAVSEAYWRRFELLGEDLP
jgi:tetratricopeptide (TPR) repeat protein